VKELEECGYIVNYELVDAVNIASERCRLFLVGIRRDLQPTKFKFPNLPHLGRGIPGYIACEDCHLGFRNGETRINPNQPTKQGQA
jgi:site-specific DNA-cytosine methylase